MTDDELNRRLRNLEAHVLRIEQSQANDLRQIKQLVEQILSRLR
jgi:hypothetical protein